MGSDRNCNLGGYVGVRVTCATCGLQKPPHGRSAPAVGAYCEPLIRHDDGSVTGCAGYHADPQVGCLWPNETCEDFGYDHCHKGAVRQDKPATDEGGGK